MSMPLATSPTTAGSVPGGGHEEQQPMMSGTTAQYGTLSTLHVPYGPQGAGPSIAGGIPVIRIVNAVSLAAVLVTNYLAGSTTVFNGVRIGDVARLFPNYLVPAPYAFSIWALIYAFLALWGMHQLRPGSYASPALNNGIGLLFPIYAATNIAWLVVWTHKQAALSVIMLMLSLAVTATMYFRIKSVDTLSSTSTYLAVHVPLSLLTGWTLGATLVNVYAVTTTRDPIYIPSAAVATWLLAALNSGIAMWARDPIVSAVGVWTLVAVSVRNAGVSGLWGVDVGAAVICAAVGGAVAWVNARIVRGRGLSA
ncbi:hypothetical protein BC828DRAFT_406391 [Blastocladiella britannica]|nr:hypothetical protein BC828DRAFT_406391 [Blastocladiella britannica]